MKYEPLTTLVVERKKLKLSRKDLSEMTNLNEQTIKALETGINNPKQAKLSTLLTICEALSITLSVLFPDEKRIK